MLLQYKGGFAARADARLGSAHARNYQGCGQIEDVNATQNTAKGYHQKQIAFE